MKSTRVFVFVPLLALAGCGNGDSFSLGSLVGSYEITGGCIADAQGSRVTASCSESDLSSSDLTSLELAATVGEKRASGTLTFAVEEDNCVCIYTVTGSMAKTSGRSASGPFSALAGDWEGEGKIEIDCEVAGEGYCYEDDASYSYTVNASIFGRTARIEGNEIGSDDTWVLEVEDRETFLFLNGEVSRKL